MKMTSVLCIIACLHAGAHGYAQKLTIHGQNASLKTIFNQIKRQTDYTFVYTDDFLEQARKVTIDVKEAPLETVLEICFRDQPFTYTIFNKMVVLKDKAEKKDVPAVAAAPPIEIRGKVSNEKGQPLDDVSVLLKGTKNGTKTDASGNFKLNANVTGKPMLEFSHVGYETQTVALGDQTTFNIIMKENASGLNDVVVIAYGKASRREVSNAIVSLSAK
ncbi:MAG: carboxypeptidase-like regulatory domain-containing protein, partial [Bacteroidetes bacterium]|nr:carboxypeptidase-like regulatory domain-containing protein [Bacteroidota bacterium]